MAESERRCYFSYLMLGDKGAGTLCWHEEINHRVEKSKRRADRSRPSEQGEDIHRIDKGAAEVYICVSCDMLVNDMER